MKTNIRIHLENIIDSYVQVGYDSKQIQTELQYSGIKVDLGDIEAMISVALGEQQ